MAKKFQYPIGAVSKTLGVSTHALRKWEDRYQAVQPTRSAGGRRRYSAADLQRLTRLKSLVDRGYAISVLAPLTDQELDQLLDGASPGQQAPAPAPEPLPVALAVIGERVADELRRAAARTPGLRVETSAATAGVLAGSTADAVVLELGSLGPDTARELARVRDRTGIAPIVILYGYGSVAMAEQLSDASTALVRRPINYPEFARTVAALVNAPSGAPALGLPPHRFTRELLARMAMISPELACECPQHVGQLLIELTDFETYSADCEQTQPQDAAMHNMLRRTSATARALFERALVQLAEAEGIDLSNPDTDERLTATG